MTPEHCTNLERQGRAMLDDRLSLVEEACAFVRQELDAGKRLPLGSCLNHSLALRYLLNREGLDARITGGEAFGRLALAPPTRFGFTRLMAMADITFGTKSLCRLAKSMLIATPMQSNALQDRKALRQNDCPRLH